MNRDRERKLFDAVTDIRNPLIEEALDARLDHRRIKWRVWNTVAACAVLLIGLSGVLVWRGVLPFGGNAGSGGSGHPEGSSTFMSYAGPVFPLTIDSPGEAVSAVRNLTYDFAPKEESSLPVNGVTVEDSYILSNSSREDLNVKALYPFTGSFDDLRHLMPQILLEGQPADSTLYAGGYSGGFTGVYGANDKGGSSNLLRLNSWEGYRTLLENGRYLDTALSPYPVLSEKVTIYDFTDYKTPPGEYSAATQAISFTIDPSKTTILHYGFEGAELGDDGFRQYNYFVPDGLHYRSQTKLLIVIGDDISEYSLQGYKDGACEKGNELDGVSVSVTRSEEYLSDVLSRLIDEHLSMIGSETGSSVPREMFLGAVSDFLSRYGLLSDAVRDRYLFGELEGIIAEANSLNRVFYLEFPVTIPAGGSVRVAVNMHKPPSYDFACSGSDNMGIQGYDMVTRLGSSLQFERLTAEVRNMEAYEIIRQNFGFNLPEGIDRVTLDTENEQYYMEIRLLDP